MPPSESLAKLVPSVVLSATGAVAVTLMEAGAAAVMLGV